MIAGQFNDLVIIFQLSLFICLLLVSQSKCQKILHFQLLRSSVSLSQTQLGICPQKRLKPFVITKLPIEHIEPVLEDGSPVIHSDQRLVITHQSVVLCDLKHSLSLSTPSPYS